jgi:hypothetical protein
MRLVPLALLFAHATAAAQPCEVTVVRAPENVRIEIESWVRAEPRCSTALEVRVVPTEGGFYLFARDPSGRVRERIVPDAQSAGVLVASWVADDGSGAIVEAPPPSVEFVPPVVVVGPGDTPKLVVTARPLRRDTPKWLSFGAMAQVHGRGAFGIRGELDFFARGAWSFGTSLSVSTTSVPLFTPDGSGFLETNDTRINATFARTSTFGKWSLRVAGGIGAVRTAALGTVTTSFLPVAPESRYIPVEGWFWNAEASIMLARRIGSSWGFSVGPVATFFNQHFEVFQDEMLTMLSRSSTDVMGFAALRHAL